MASFFSDSEKLSISSLFDDLHDTFKKDIYVFVKQAESIPSSVNYNALYERAKDQSIGVSDQRLTKYTISARIQYYKKGEEDVIDLVGLPSSENVVRLKVDANGLDLLNRCVHVEIDGAKYSVLSDPENIGPFANNYYKVYMKRDT